MTLGRAATFLLPSEPFRPNRPTALRTLEGNNFLKDMDDLKAGSPAGCSHILRLITVSLDRYMPGTFMKKSRFVAVHIGVSGKRVHPKIKFGLS